MSTLLKFACFSFRAVQEVELDSKIKLIDCPGIVFTKSDNMPAVLKNAQRVGDVKDPFTVAESVLKRASKQYFCKLYDITDYDTFDEFFAKKAARMGIYAYYENFASSFTSFVFKGNF